MDVLDDIAVELSRNGFYDFDYDRNRLFVHADGGRDITENDLDLVYDIASSYASVDVYSHTPTTITIEVVWDQNIELRKALLKT